MAICIVITGINPNTGTWTDETLAACWGTVFEIYKDINSGSSAHSVQQIRRASFWGDYIKLLMDLSASEAGAYLCELHNITDKAKVGPCDSHKCGFEGSLSMQFI